MTDTIKDHFDTIACLAEKSFANHELTSITEDDEGHTYVYRCRNPKSFAYSFTAIFRPGFVAVYGDTGDIVLNCDDGDTRAWVCRQQAPYFDYMLGRRPEGCRPPDWFMAGEVSRWIAEWIEECGDGDDGDADTWREARREWRYSDQTPNDALEVVQDNYGDTEVMDAFYAPSSTSIWGCHALMCWKRLFEAQVHNNKKGADGLAEKEA